METTISVKAETLRSACGRRAVTKFLARRWPDCIFEVNGKPLPAVIGGFWEGDKTIAVRGLSGLLRGLSGEIEVVLRPRTARVRAPARQRSVLEPSSCGSGRR